MSAEEALSQALESKLEVLRTLDPIKDAEAYDAAFSEVIGLEGARRKLRE